MRTASACAAGGDKAVALQDPPHGRDRGRSIDLADQVMSDGFGPGIMTVGDQLLAQPQDFGLDLGRCLVRALNLLTSL